MSTSNRSYKSYSFIKHGKVYQLLEKVFHEFSITYYLIGANARDVQLYKSGIDPIRMTADIDFAITINEIEVYDQICERLLSLGFTKSNERYRLYYKHTNTVLDLIPYGEIEKGRMVRFSDVNLDISVLGFMEVGKHIELVSVKEEGFIIPTTPLEGIFILKLIAWNEKRHRLKDIEDLAFLIKHGWDFYEEEAYKNHLDIFEIDDFNTIHASARILGRKMRPILMENEELLKNIDEILDTAVRPKEKLSEPELTASKVLEKSIRETQLILAEIRNGIHD